jgi:hypothetical protein
MIVALRPGCSIRIPGSVPQRRRVVIIGATEAGVSAAYHLGAFALLLEKRGACGPARPALFEDSEMRLGTRVTALEVRERRLELSTGETIVYDKLISTLRATNLQWLIADQLPTRVQSMEARRYWLNGRDIELLDGGQAAGRRMAGSLREALALKYTGKQLFQPRVVGAD